MAADGEQQTGRVLWLDPVVLLSVVWVAGEMLLIALRRPTETDAKKTDRGSFGLLMIVMYSAIGVGVWMGVSRIGLLPGPLFLPLHYSGAVLIVAGLVIRWTAIRTLGRFFTVKVTLREGHRVVRDGLYRYVRHPSYSGALLSFVGLAVSFASWATFVVILVPVFTAMAYRIHVEEAVLVQGLGEDYRQYQRTTARLIPGVY